MSRQLSEVLELVSARAELSSSILIGLDDARRYGDITAVEHDVANKRIGLWLQDNDGLGYYPFSTRQRAFKMLIEQVKKYESL